MHSICTLRASVDISLKNSHTVLASFLNPQRLGVAFLHDRGDVTYVSTLTTLSPPKDTLTQHRK